MKNTPYPFWDKIKISFILILLIPHEIGGASIDGIKNHTDSTLIKNQKYKKIYEIKNDSEIFIGREHSFDKLSLSFYNETTPLFVGKIGLIQNIVSNENSVVFNTTKYLLCYDYDKVKIIDSTDFYFNLFSYDNTIYIYKHDVGIFQYDENKLTLILNNKEKNIGEVVKIKITNNELLILAEKDNQFKIIKYKRDILFSNFLILISLIILAVLVIFVFVFYMQYFKKKATVSLKGIPQKEVTGAPVMKRKPDTERFRMVTVLFSDIQGFSKLTQRVDTDVLINELDHFFLYLDSLIEKYNIEKIKTIGDAYMCAGGIPTKNRTNPLEVMLAALEIKQYMGNLKKHFKEKENIWDIRIGIHTGPVIAGILGKKKISYDIWGDTVNVASRMEASCTIGQINITGTTYEIIKDFFICEHRGKMPVKYKGGLDMYYVTGLKPQYTIDVLGIKPNKDFIIQLQLIRYEDLEEYMLDRMGKELSHNLYYHNLKHTIDVCTQVELIGLKEEVSSEELLLLKTAALFHDAGFMEIYNGHENVGIEMAREILPKYFYTSQQIDKICKLILATLFPPKPKNKLEKIICDADLDYLGRKDFIYVSNNLYKELKERDMIDNMRQWNDLQIAFIEKHQYYTKTAVQLREINKIKQLENIRVFSKNNRYE